MASIGGAFRISHCNVQYGCDIQHNLKHLVQIYCVCTGIDHTNRQTNHNSTKAVFRIVGCCRHCQKGKIW